MHKRDLPLAVVPHKIKVKILDAASNPEGKKKKKEMHDKNKLVGKYMHIYTPTNITTARQVVHLTTTNCEYFENYITKATEVIFNISMNICYTTSIIVQLCALSSQPNLITYQILHLI